MKAPGKVPTRLPAHAHVSTAGASHRKAHQLGQAMRANEVCFRQGTPRMPGAGQAHSRVHSRRLFPTGSSTGGRTGAFQR